VNPQLAIKFCELKKLFNHIPVESRLQIEGQLRAIFNQIEAAMNYQPQPPAPKESV
jgi:hypothetical protein